MRIDGHVSSTDMDFPAQHPTAVTFQRRRGQESARGSSEDLPTPKLFAASFGSCCAPASGMGSQGSRGSGTLWGVTGRDLWHMVGHLILDRNG